MFPGLELILENLNISLPNLLLMVWFLGCIIVAAKDIKLAMIFLVLGCAGIFVFLYAMSMDYVPALYGLMISLVLMAFSLYFVSKTSTTGGLV